MNVPKNNSSHKKGEVDVVSQILAEGKKDIEPEKKKKPKKAGTRKITQKDYVINLIVLIMLIWELGLMEDFSVTFTGAFKEKKIVIIRQNFMIIEPDFDVELNRALGRVKMRLINTANDETVLTGLKVINTYNQEDCTFDLQLPKSLKPGEIIEIKATGCEISKTPVSTLVALGLLIDGTTTLRARMLSDTNPSIPGPMIKASPEAIKAREKMIRVKVMDLDDANMVVSFKSSGTVVMR